MKRKIITSFILVVMLCLSMINAPSAFAYSDFADEITNLPDVMDLTDEPITITEVGYIFDGKADSIGLSIYDYEVDDPNNAMEITPTYDGYTTIGTGLESLTFTPKKAGIVKIVIGGSLGYYKTIHVIDPNMPAKQRDIPQSVKVEKYVPKKLKISWENVYGAEEYRIFRSTSGKDGTFKKIKTTTKTSFIDSGLTSGKTYYYKIKAVTADGVSNFSKMKKCRVARKLNIKVDMRNKAGETTRSAKVQVTNYGKNTFKILQEVEYIGGREFISYASYYPYQGATNSDATMVNGDGKPLTSYSFKKNTTAVVRFRLDNQRIPQKDAHIVFEAVYDGVYYTINAGNGFIAYSYGYPGCGVKYDDDTVYLLD